MKCESCVETKDKPMTYTRCRQCNYWRPMTEAEKLRASKPYRFDSSGAATQNY